MSTKKVYSWVVQKRVHPLKHSALETLFRFSTACQSGLNNLALVKGNTEAQIWRNLKRDHPYDAWWLIKRRVHGNMARRHKLLRAFNLDMERWAARHPGHTDLAMREYTTRLIQRLMRGIDEKVAKRVIASIRRSAGWPCRGR